LLPSESNDVDLVPPTGNVGWIPSLLDENIIFPLSVLALAWFGHVIIIYDNIRKIQDFDKIRKIQTLKAVISPQSRTCARCVV